MGKLFSNNNQLQEWVEAAEGIEERFGIEKALGYVIGEKFYNIISGMQYSRKQITMIDTERKKPNYQAIREVKLRKSTYTENSDEIYEQEKENIIESEKVLAEFADLIKQTFDPHKIRQYFNSHPRLGVYGHIGTEEQFDFMVSKGAIEHNIDTEIEDALIFGEMMKYFGMS
ncbi:MAG: hypothetical protein ACLP29_05700 [Dissulfurispiraceae bacterium]